MSDYNRPVQHQADVTTTGPTSFIGTVNVVIFERSLFRILSVTVEDSQFNWDTDTITVKGQLGDVVEGDRYEFEGRVVDDQRYGLQFASTGCHVVMPQTSSQLTTYLKYHHVELNHPRKSTKLVFDALGSQAIDTILDQPDSLDDIPGMDQQDRQRMKEFFSKLDFGNTTGQIIDHLQKYGFTERQVNQIFDQYGAKTLTTIAEDPYQLAVDLYDQGITFRLVDQVAQRFYSVNSDDYRRLGGAIRYCLKAIINSSGGTYVRENVLLAGTSQLLRFQIDAQRLGTQLKRLIHDEILVVDDEDKIYENAYYNAEWKIAQKLHELLKNDDTDRHVKVSEVQQALAPVEQDKGYKYDRTQLSAITKALNSPVMLLTGGPGTGKTTIVNGIVEAFLNLNPDKSRDDVMLAAPTGRAAKQINSVTGIDAGTIHRLLGLTADITDQKLMEMEFDPLQADLLIVDEMSMTSTALFTGLMSAVQPGTHLVLVGDCDQLPSVGPGQVFHDLLETKVIPQQRLKHIYRQSSNSSIIPLAHHINDGQVDLSLFAPKDPAHFAHRQFIRASFNNIADLICQAVKLYHEKHQVPIMDIQILAPIHGGPAGTQNINQVLQANLNPDDGSKPAIKMGSQLLRVGDKVMQTVNDPDKNVFNGDLGIIKSIEGQNVIHGSQKSRVKQKVVVDFEGEEVEYRRLNEIHSLRLAYCMTIHKAQGSQAPVVIISMVNQYFPVNLNTPTIMHRNLLYTAVTRSSQALLMVGDPEAFVRCAETPTRYRQTTLTQRVTMVFKHQHFESDTTQDAQMSTVSQHDRPEETVQSHDQISEKNLILTPEMVEEQLIDPMIGMDGITPDDF